MTTTASGQRTYRYPIPGDRIWIATVEGASGVTDSNVKVYAPAGEELLALALRAPGTRVLSVSDRGPALATFPA